VYEPEDMANPARHSKSRHRLSCLTTLAPALAAAVLASLAAGPALALDAAIVKGLRELDMSARLEQRCDYEAMLRIARDEKHFSPDRVVAGVTEAPKVDGDVLTGDGAAFRSKGEWYSLSYVCKTSDDHMDVLDFGYRIGDLIPEDKWEEYGLWD
jgi:hypothetical protein